MKTFQALTISVMLAMAATISTALPVANEMAVEARAVDSALPVLSAEGIGKHNIHLVQTCSL